MKIRKLKESFNKDDWDFDFSAYEQQEEVEEDITSLRKMIDNKPKSSNLKSKYSAWASELEGLQLIKMKISKYSIRVAQNTNEISDLWALYGCMDEFWARIADIYGKTIYYQIETLFKKCRQDLQSYKSDSPINYKTHTRLLLLRKMLYMITQRSKLGIITERAVGGSMAKVKKAIVE